VNSDEARMGARDRERALLTAEVMRLRSALRFVVNRLDADNRPDDEDLIVILQTAKEALKEGEPK
jgi:hypothetical protein